MAEIGSGGPLPSLPPPTRIVFLVGRVFSQEIEFQKEINDVGNLFSMKSKRPFAAEPRYYYNQDTLLESQPMPGMGFVAELQALNKKLAERPLHHSRQRLDALCQMKFFEFPEGWCEPGRDGKLRKPPIVVPSID
ncbi:hypothetical protein [Labrenzia sp. DG1229]|uniref:hypothetical protein n=1 Tax=Labrenzia sp. DG1229 TaxID=681847 RepID=UPI0012EBF36F|nr:hypothetical protein [Labrenzia sp. DG1229]